MGSANQPDPQTSTRLRLLALAPVEKQGNDIWSHQSDKKMDRERPKKWVTFEMAKIHSLSPGSVFFWTLSTDSAVCVSGQKRPRNFEQSLNLRSFLNDNSTGGRKESLGPHLLSLG